MGAVSYWAGEDFLEDVTVAVGLVFGAVAENRNGAVLGEALEEAERSVLSLGTHATVIRPEKLRERLSKATEELWQRYGGPMVLHDKA